MTNDPEVTRILIDISQGDRSAVDRLLPLVYDELRRLAQDHLRYERPDHTLQATALVHEAYLRLVDQTRVQWQSRAHFFAVAATAIRRILVDHARRHGAEKRGGGREKVALENAVLVAPGQPSITMVALDLALTKLATEHPEHARIVELRYFGGLTTREIAEVLDVTERTIERRWRFAKAWLYRELTAGE